MKARKVITRSSRKTTVKFPSKKLDRMVECESLIERDACFLIEYSPGFKYYQEQPALVMYESQNEMKEYYPDFGITFRSGATLHIEVKPDSELVITRFTRHSSSSSL